MQFNENQYKSKRIFDKETKTWFEVTPEQYAEYDRWRTQLRQREQYHGRCSCTRDKWWLCDGMCDFCEFHCGEIMLSMDSSISEEEVDGQRILDCLCSDSPSLEEKYADIDLVEKLFHLLREMVPDADKIIALWKEDFRISDRKIAEAIGRPQRTFSHQMERYRKAAKKILEK